MALDWIVFLTAMAAQSASPARVSAADRLRRKGAVRGTRPVSHLPRRRRTGRAQSARPELDWPASNAGLAASLGGQLCRDILTRRRFPPARSISWSHICARCARCGRSSRASGRGISRRRPRTLPFFNRTQRDAEERPELLMNALEIPRGATVADLGSGTGYFTWRLAREVGPTGKVLAIDVQQSMLDLTKAAVTGAQARQR